MTQPAGKKISQFIGITELEDSDYVTLVSAGVNYKMTVANFKAGLGVAGDAPKGLISLQGNTTDTDIVTQNVPVLVAGTWSSTTVDNFSASAAGRLTYTGAITRNFMIDSTVTMHPAASNVDCAMLIAKNGAVITASQMWSHISHNAEQQVSSNWIVSLAQNDYVEIFVSNLSGTQDIEVNSAIIRATVCP